ncbi:MAG: SGNH/GDSL hydrolase family protein [Propioniciclava sp.]|uniref:SGNH/GDSL hydrolase family protein n=1 Tax=Propioniciclava sp. TaxID=2038686 RepID=UPI0039E6C709
MRPTTKPDAGVSLLEVVGMTILAAILAGGLFAVVAPGLVRDQFGAAACAILNRGDCAEGSGASSAPHEMTPYERATSGSAWFGGDSFASGEGLPTYEEGTNVTGFNWKNPLTWWPTNWDDERNMCHRSGTSYQAQVFETLRSKGAFGGQSYRSEACSGSTVPNIYSDNQQGNAGEGPQMYEQPTTADETGPFTNIPQDASLITLSMGGNDIGFADVLQNCVTAGIVGSGCGDTGALQKRIDQVYGTNGSPGTLEQQLAKVKSEHPDARIILMGYPQLFSEASLYLRDSNGDLIMAPASPYGGGGPIMTWNGSGMDIDDQKWANMMAGRINTSGQQMAERLGIEWIDPTSAFVGPGYDHRIGSDDPWINGLSAGSNSGDFTLNNGSFHPNQGGHDAMAGLLLQQIQEGPR